MSELVHVELRHRSGDLGHGEHSDSLALEDQTLDLFEFLQIDD